MNVGSLIGRGLASGFGLAIVLMLGAGPVSAATTLTLDPDRATPGTRITITNACLGITATPPDELRTAFVSASTPNLSPTDPSVLKSVARSRAGGYVVIVPELEPGVYDVRLECLPGDWRTNTAEGGAQRLTVIAGAPSTNTGEQVGPGLPVRDPLGPLLLLGLAIAGGIAADRWLMKRRSDAVQGGRGPA